MSQEFGVFFKVTHREELTNEEISKKMEALAIYIGDMYVR